MNPLSENLLENTPFFKNQRQADIYLCLLKEGLLGAEKISQSTGIYRETVQRELVKMKSAKLINIIQYGRNKKAQAISLSALQGRLDKNRENFDFLLKPLLEVEGKKRFPKMEIYTGNYSFGILQTKLIRFQPRKEDIFVISAHPKEWINAMIESSKLPVFERIRLEKGVVFKLLCLSELRGEVEYNNREYFTGQSEKLKRQYKYIESKLSSPIQIQIWFNRVVISIFDAYPSVHVVIEDARVVKAMKSYFSILWKTGKK